MPCSDVAREDKKTAPRERATFSISPTTRKKTAKLAKTFWLFIHFGIVWSAVVVVVVVVFVVVHQLTSVLHMPLFDVEAKLSLFAVWFTHQILFHNEEMKKRISISVVGFSCRNRINLNVSFNKHQRSACDNNLFGWKIYIFGCRENKKSSNSYKFAFVYSILLFVVLVAPLSFAVWRWRHDSIVTSSPRKCLLLFIVECSLTHIDAVYLSRDEYVSHVIAIYVDRVRLSSVTHVSPLHKYNCEH